MTSLCFVLLVALTSQITSAVINTNLNGELDHDIHYGFRLHKDQCTAIGVGE